MKKIILLIFLLTFFVNCNKEDSEPDYTAFLNINVPGFSGDRDENPFNWKSSWGNLRNSSGIIIGASTPHNLSENESILTYSLIKQNANILYLPDFCSNDETYEVKYGFDMGSPKFNYISDDILNSALKLGKKNIGNLENAFNLTVYINGKKYCVKDDVEVIEILKTENIEDNDSHYILVWLVLDNIVLDDNEDGESINISNGKIIAKFRPFTD